MAYYEDFMPESETSSAVEDSPKPSGETSLTKDALTELLADVLFRVQQKNSGGTPAAKSEEVADSVEPCLADNVAETRSTSSASKKAASSKKKSASPIATVASGISKPSKLTIAQTKKKVANFQRLQKQLASQIDELLGQLE